MPKKCGGGKTGKVPEGVQIWDTWLKWEGGSLGPAQWTGKPHGGTSRVGPKIQEERGRFGLTKKERPSQWKQDRKA